MRFLRQKFVAIYLFLLIHICGNEANSGYQVCDSPQCLKSAEIYNGVNSRFLPCIDFYGYVCTQWMYNSGTTFANKLYQNYDTIFHDTIRMLKTDIQPTDSEAFKKTKQIYQMCIGNLNDTGRDDLKAILKNMGGWPLFNSRSNRNISVSWQDVIKELDQLNIYGPLYDINIEIDIETRRRRVKIKQPQIHQDNLLRKVVDYMVADEGYTRFHGDFQMSVRDGLAFMQLFRQNLMKITVSDSTKQKMSIREFQQAYDESINKAMFVTQIDWLAVIKNRFPVDDMDDSELIYVENLSYFKKLGKVLSTTTMDTILNYIIWTFVVQTLRYVSDTTRDLVKFPREPEAKEILCLVEPNLVHVKNYEYMKLYSPEDMIHGAAEVTNSIKSQFLKQISDLQWMDNTTKTAAKDDMLFLRVQIGGPIWWYNDENLNGYYENVEVESSYLNTILNVLDFQVIEQSWQLQQERLDISRDANYEFTTDVIDLVSKYDTTLDTITIPAALVSKSYVVNGPPAINYGLLGSTLAYEMMQAYDFERVRYKHDGFSTRWSNKAVRTYDQKTLCFVEQNIQNEVMEMNNLYNAHAALQVHIGTSGLQAAYRAFKESTKEKPEIRLPTVQHTADQLFFISYASAFCERQPMQVPSSRARVLISLINMDEFAEAFKCPVGFPMNPKKKCKLWE